MKSVRPGLTLRQAQRLCLWALICFFLIAIGVLIGEVFASQGAEEQLWTIPFPLDRYGDGGWPLWKSLAHRVQVSPFNLIALAIFILAVIHTFFASRFTALAHHLERLQIIALQAQGITYDKERDLSFTVELLYFLGEVEIVFGLWVIPLLMVMTYWYNWESAVKYLSQCNYREPMFVIVIMAIASTRPIIRLAERFVQLIARLFGGGAGAWWFSLLTIGPLLGSFITEPGAMTVTALLLGKQFYSRQPSTLFAYATLGLLFVNVSIGGVLTNFAAPPVLIVAEQWKWSTLYMFTHFGWKSIVSIIVANLVYFLCFRREFGKLDRQAARDVGIEVLHQNTDRPVPIWITCVHVLALAWIVYSGHEPVIFLGSFLLFLGFYQATRPHQSELRLRPPLLIGLFLSGLVVLGTLQGWWIALILERFTQLPLMAVATAMTAINDNTMITYLSSLPAGFTETLEYAVMAGAITGGGLTVIANAPNPAGQQILSRYFKDGVNPLRLFLGALIPTVIIFLGFIFLYPKHLIPS